ncbi:hypothetical protein [Actinoplanes siamensis]|uniref:Uncharacterized protein n=1 Tax=Actinoplanes siamensis TaxID=1223317 RepID=A0A919TQ40_9ACTN|nr:hypothetical protein [Actinoplanes siamensis]GIF09728.1 hypothetical protein Asi03nite_72660 [Actinoplanes siamensis]
MMQKTMRGLALAGLGMLAGLAVASAPASAAPAAGQPGGGASADQQRNTWDDDEVVGYYRDFWSCERAGMVGQRLRSWSDHECLRVRHGIRRGAFALIVDRNDRNDRWDGRWRPGNWPADWPYRPQWPGAGRPAPDRPDGPDRPDRPGPGGAGRPDRPGNGGPGGGGPRTTR